MKAIRLKDIKKDVFFRLKNDLNAPLWRKSHYDKSSKTYSIYPIDDFNRELFRLGTVTVFVEDFE